MGLFVIDIVWPSGGFVVVYWFAVGFYFFLFYVASNTVKYFSDYFS